MGKRIWIKQGPPEIVTQLVILSQYNIYDLNLVKVHFTKWKEATWSESLPGLCLCVMSSWSIF